MVYKLKNLKDKYQHIQWQNKHFYDFKGGEIKEVDPEIIPHINTANFEIIEESATVAKVEEPVEKPVAKPKKKRVYKKKVKK